MRLELSSSAKLQQPQQEPVGMALFLQVDSDVKAAQPLTEGRLKGSS